MSENPCSLHFVFPGTAELPAYEQLEKARELAQCTKTMNRFKGNLFYETIYIQEKDHAFVIRDRGNYILIDFDTDPESFPGTEYCTPQWEDRFCSVEITARWERDVPFTEYRIPNMLFDAYPVRGIYFEQPEDLQLPSGAVYLPDTCLSFMGKGSTIEHVYLNEGLIEYGGFRSPCLRELTIPSTVADILPHSFPMDLFSVKLSENNRWYCSADDIIYDREMQHVLFIPVQKRNFRTVLPDTVTCIDTDCLGESESDYVYEDLCFYGLKTLAEKDTVSRFEQILWEQANDVSFNLLKLDAYFRVQNDYPLREDICSEYLGSYETKELQLQGKDYPLGNIEDIVHVLHEVFNLLEIEDAITDESLYYHTGSEFLRVFEVYRKRYERLWRYYIRKDAPGSWNELIQKAKMNLTLHENDPVWEDECDEY